MPPPRSDEPERISRPQLLERLRGKLLALAGPDHCVCTVAGRLGLPCKGFAQFSDAEFRQRFAWIADRRPRATRRELEDAVNAFLLARQEVTGAVLACDVETREHDACGGWNTFDNAALEALYERVVGRPIRIGAD